MKRSKLLVLVSVLVISACHKNTSNQVIVNPPAGNDSTFTNPVLTKGPDPWVIQKDSFYYVTHTFGNRIAVYQTKKMSELSNAPVTTIWSPPSTGAYSKDIWAPEIHLLQGKWYAYFAADDGNNANHRMYVLENSSA